MVGVRCAERKFNCAAKKSSVKLVVFDLDETLTLTTFMTKDGTYTPDQFEFAAKVNFESPWVDGSRIERLKQLFTDLARGKDGQPRTLAILTRNDNAGGVAAVVSLLKVAGLDIHFSVVWSMPWRARGPNGTYREGDEWKPFNPPINKVPDHKANVLVHIGQHLEQWIPNLGCEGGPSLPAKLSNEEIVLVDDQRANFQSSGGVKVLRYCKVMRYDAWYYDFGLMKDMGGIGARDLRDFAILTRFVEDPQDFKESLVCNAVQLDGAHRRPVSLILFDFDETLTLATFMPEDEACQTQVGWTPQDSASCEWNVADLVSYNFESPWVSGSRVEKLKAMLTRLTQGEDGQQRTLAVLTRNQTGAVSVLNLLLMAGLAKHFCVIWRLPRTDQRPEGVYCEAGQWRSFELPVANTSNEPMAAADVLHDIAERPYDWFPQLRSENPCVGTNLTELVPQEIALVDDERANFWSNTQSGAVVHRYCKVMRYDEEYRDCGLLHDMGGIGAHSDEDYEIVERFVNFPWEFPYKGSRPQTIQPGMERPLDKAVREVEVEKVKEEMMIKVPSMRRKPFQIVEENERGPRRRLTAQTSGS